MEKMGELLLEKEYISRGEFEMMMKDPKKIDEMVGEVREKYKKDEDKKKAASEEKKSDQGTKSKKTKRGKKK